MAAWQSPAACTSGPAPSTRRHGRTSASRSLRGRITASSSDPTPPPRPPPPPPPRRRRRGERHKTAQTASVSARARTAHRGPRCLSVRRSSVPSECRPTPSRRPSSAERSRCSSPPRSIPTGWSTCPRRACSPKCGRRRRSHSRTESACARSCREEGVEVSQVEVEVSQVEVLAAGRSPRRAPVDLGVAPRSVEVPRRDVKVVRRLRVGGAVGRAQQRDVHRFEGAVVGGAVAVRRVPV